MPPDTEGVSAKQVSAFHKNADTDGSTKAIHHTLGSASNQAAPGNHTHDGGQSAFIDSSNLNAGAPQTMIRAKISPTADLPVATGTVTAVPFGVTNYDTNAMADLANNRLVVKTAGWYAIYAKVVWASNATGYRAHLIYVNGGIVADSYYACSPNSNTIMSYVTEPLLLAVNDQIALRVAQGSGVSLNLSTANGRYGHLAAELISYA